MNDYKKTNRAIGERLKQYLAENNLTQKELGRKIGRSQQLISRFALGRVKLSWAIACEIAKLHPEKDKLAEWLMGESETQESDAYSKGYIQAKKDIYEAIASCKEWEE